MRLACLILLMAPVVISRAATAGLQSVSPPQEGALKSHKVISQETYDRVLDILFPRDDPAENYRLVLRFKPSFHPEAQVLIKAGLKKVEVVEYTSASGNIYSKLNELISRGTKEDAVELAKLIEVRRRSVEAPPAQVRRWHAGFFESLDGSLKTFRKESEQFNKDGSIEVVLDGTFYDLWYSQGVGEMSFSFYDVEVSDQQPNGLLKSVQWMNAVRREVGRLK